MSPSPWPVFTSISLLTLATSGVLTMHGFAYARYSLQSALILVRLSMFFLIKSLIEQGLFYELFIGPRLLAKSASEATPE